jgi:DNA-directed RNA polymerase subunit M/transcription elongation factor TFIIS
MTNMELSTKSEPNAKPIEKKPVEIRETKCTCQACNNVWFYGKQDKRQAVGSAMGNCGKSMMCCSGCAPALLIPDRQVVNLNKCPKCGSRAVVKEEIVHHV